MGNALRNARAKYMRISNNGLQVNYVLTVEHRVPDSYRFICTVTNEERHQTDEEEKPLTLVLSASQAHRVSKVLGTDLHDPLRLLG